MRLTGVTREEKLHTKHAGYILLGKMRVVLFRSKMTSFFGMRKRKAREKTCLDRESCRWFMERKFYFL